MARFLSPPALIAPLRRALYGLGVRRDYFVICDWRRFVLADSTISTASTDGMDGVGLDFLDGVPAGLYIWGEIHKVWDKVTRKTGEVKYQARMLIDEEPGVIQVNITDLPQEDIRYMAMHEREMVLLGLRYFLIDGSLYFKAVELITAESLSASASGSSGSLLADLKKKSGRSDAA